MSAGVSIIRVDIRAVVDVNRCVVHTAASAAVAAPAVATVASVPGVVSLVGRQRHPADIPESEVQPNVEAAVAVVAKEGDQRRTPIVTAIAMSRIPAPAVAGVLIPAAIVVGRPAPGLVAHPRPAVVIEVGPASVAIRRPTG